MRAMQMLRKVQDVTANNLANINTPGYKGSNVFQKMVQQGINGQTVSRLMPQEQIDMQQGVLKPTHNPLDFGLKGKGFFVVKDNNGTHLTRDGRMHFDTDGYLVDGNGAHVMGDSGAVYMPEYMKATGGDVESAQVEVAKDGTIRLDNKVFDRLRIVKVNNTSKLEREGKNYLTAPEKSLVDDQSSTVMQGYYEAGNVDPLNEMVDMMKTTKMFESQQRAIRSSSEMLEKVTNRLGKF